MDYETGTVDRPGNPTELDDEPARLRCRTVLRWIAGLTRSARPSSEQPWPADPNTRGFVTARSRYVHRTTECVKYAHTVNMAQQLGRTVHPPVWTTTGAARANGKGICSFCWTS